ncbi:MAG: CDC48 family AAA ATPase [Thermoplasmatales archaeon]
MVDYVTLVVWEALQEDVGLIRARIDQATREALGVSIGEIIRLEGKKVTAARVFRLSEEEENRGIIRIDPLVRQNSGVRVGDKIKVSKAEVKPAETLVLAPIIAENQRIRFAPGIEDYVRRSLLRRPIVEGDIISVQGLALTSKGGVSFKVAKVGSGKGIFIVTEDTMIEMREEAISAEEEGEKITYEDIGGLGEELKKVREMIELPLKHPELFERLGIDPPKGVILYGPPGTGKTLIAKAVANESGARFFSINGPEIINKFYGESEKALRETFDRASKESPSIIFIDEIDSIAPKREETQGELERRVVAQLLTLMDGLKSRGQVIVIAATNRLDAVDPALRRPGRFDREIEIGVPDRNGRKEILQIHSRGMPFDGKPEQRDKLLDELASVTHGFVGADLAALTREAAMKALRRYLPEIDLDNPIPTEVLERMHVTSEDFFSALKEIEPSSLREVMIEIPNVKWDDIGDLEDAKRELIETVELPVKNPEVFERMGLKPSRGILFFGPPGTGKTLLAKAVATESQSNFISIKGPEVMSKWVGESEKAVREIFKKAKQSAPTIIFLDELDAIAPRRGVYASSGVTDRIVNQLLTSMDGMEAMKGVTVLAATNRLDIIDPGLLRPGRFDKIIYIAPPNREARLKILKVHTRKMPLAKDVDLDLIAERTEHYTGADIENLVREAGLNAIRNDINAKMVTMDDFTIALKRVKPSLDEETIKYYEEVSKNMSREAKPARREDLIYYR